MDLKSPNVLLQDKNFLVAKIADMGLSRQITEGSLLTNTGHGVHMSICDLQGLTESCCRGFEMPAQGRLARVDVAFIQGAK